MKSWITDSEGMLGAIEKQAKHVSKVWYNTTKRRETAALWGQRQDVNKGCVVPMSELWAQVAEAMRARRMRKENNRTNQEYLKMSRNSLRIFWRRSRHKLGASPADLQSVQRKATQKGNSQTGKGYWKLGQTQQEAFQEAQRTKEAPEKIEGRKQRRKEPHISTGVGISITINQKLIDLEWS
jgi:hypothetical protein